MSAGISFASDGYIVGEPMRAHEARQELLCLDAKGLALHGRYAVYVSPDCKHCSKQTYSMGRPLSAIMIPKAVVVFCHLRENRKINGKIT